MIDIGISVSGSLKLPNSQEVAGAIRRGMAKVGILLENQAKIFAPVKHGRLRASISSAVSNDGMSAVVGTVVEYAPRQELGFKGQENVRAHKRTITQAFGRAIPPRSVDVSPFTRQANTPAHPFLRPAVEQMVQRGNIVYILQNEIDKAVGQ